MEEVTKAEGYLYKSAGSNAIAAYKILEDSDNDENSSDNDSSNSVEHESQWAGKIELTDENGEVWLNHIEVKPSHRRNGIATKLVELAIDHCELSHIPAVTESSEYKYSLTGDGERLIAGCLRKKIISPDMCYFSSMSDRKFSRAILEGDDDPGYDSLVITSLMPTTGNFHNSDNEDNKGNSDNYEELNSGESNSEEESETNQQIHDGLLQHGYFSSREKQKESEQDANTLSTTDYRLKWKYGLTIGIGSKHTPDNILELDTSFQNPPSSGF